MSGHKVEKTNSVTIVFMDLENMCMRNSSCINLLEYFMNNIIGCWHLKSISESTLIICIIVKAHFCVIESNKNSKNV